MMNRSHTPKALLVAGLVILTCTGAAFAQGPGDGRGGRGGPGQCLQTGEFGPGQDRHLERMAARLDLTEEQQAAIAELQEENRGKNLELRKQMLRLRNELDGELLKDAPNSKSVLALNEQLGDLRTAMKANRLQNRLAVRELLTPEQRDKMLLMGEGRGRGRGEGRGHGWDRDCDAGRGPRGGRGLNDECPLGNR